jgi:hypothetical protein
MTIVCPITGTQLPLVPIFAQPVIACTGSRIAVQGNASRPRPERQHCGGCGMVHAAFPVVIFDEPVRSADEACRLAGMRAAHLAVTYDDDGAIFHAASHCCGDVREAAAWHLNTRWHVSTQWHVVMSASERRHADAAEAWSERQYASSYGLGL